MIEFEFHLASLNRANTGLHSTELQQASDDTVTLDEDARAAIDRPVGEVLLNILDNGFVLSTRLQPYRRD